MPLSRLSRFARRIARQVSTPDVNERVAQDLKKAKSAVLPKGKRPIAKKHAKISPAIAQERIRTIKFAQRIRKETDVTLKKAA